MTQDHETMLDLVAAYALGTLPAADVAAVREHLQTCDDCAREYAALRPVVSALAYSAEACATGEQGPQVSALLKPRIMRAIREPAQSARRFPRWAYAAAAAIVLLAGAAGIYETQMHRQALPVSIVYVAGGRVHIDAHAFPALPRGRVYQAWTLARGARTVAPSMTFAAGSHVTLPVAAGHLTAVAISVEPAGGSRQPTTKPIAFVRLAP